MLIVALFFCTIPRAVSGVGYVLFCFFSFAFSVGLLSPSAFPFRIAKSRQFSRSRDGRVKMSIFFRLYIKRKKAKTILVLPLLYAVTHSALLYSALRDINKWYAIAFVMRKSSVLTVGTSVFKKALQSYNFFLNCAIVRELFFEKFTICLIYLTN